MGSDLYIGLMSGTSIDSVDAALVDISTRNATLLDHHSEPIEPSLRRQVADLCSPGTDEIERMGVLDRRLGRLFAQAANALLTKAGLDPDRIRAIGSHGQTIRHRPGDAERSPAEAFTCQIGDPNTIAEHTGITTVADFRRRDIAAGGQGAPLVPLFHQAVFAAPGIQRAIINIGGMANISLPGTDGQPTGFDTGPGNILLDSWINLQRGEAFDRDGEWAATGRAPAALIQSLLQHPFLAAAAPKSTGREDFNLDWLQQQLVDLPPQPPADVQAALLELTAQSIANEVRRADPAVQEVYICGGGACNKQLMNRLAQLLQPRKLADTSSLGIPPQWVEASAFAWLAHQCLLGQPGNATKVTGATGSRVLGGIFQGSGPRQK